VEVEKLEMEGPLLIHGARHHDERGYFSETYNQREMREIGLPDFVQDNLSRSANGVFRGLHWQVDPMAQGKLVTCLQGAIADVIVDIRRSSSTFGQPLKIFLNDSNLISLWVPRGFAHGFLSLQPDTLVSYKVDNFWSPRAERG
jgi:dTDP-4-dehydrorhamnose 3,5-epimerase